MRTLSINKEDNWEVTLDLEQLNPEMKVSDLQEVASRRKVYMIYFMRSKLTEYGWTHAMAISLERHRAYKALSVLVPNSVLNKAAKVAKRVKFTINRLHNEGI
jgi:hypothetical protein